MKNPFIIVAALLLTVSTRSLSYSEDELAPNDRDFTYLDYVKAREREYEYAMHLRDAMRREENGYRRVDENDDFDEDTVDEQERFDDDDDDEEEGNEDRYGKMKRGLKKEERLKEQIIDRKDHHNKANYDKGKLRDVKSSNYIKNKHNKYNGKMSKDAKTFREEKSDIKSSKRAKLKDTSENDKPLKKSEENIIEARDQNGMHNRLSVDSMPSEVAKEQNDKREGNDDPAAVKVTQTTKTTSAQSPPAPKPIVRKKNEKKKLDKALFVVVIAACSVAGVAGLILAGYCWYRLRSEQDGVPDEDTKKYVKKKKKPKKIEMTNDQKLAKSAEVYHYMHTKKQLASMEKNGSERKASNVESETSDEESDNTVYECPGLAPPGDMKVVNPLFSDAEKEHSDTRSDGSHVSSPTRDNSPPKNETEHKKD